MGTKWGPKKRIFDKLTKTCKFNEINRFFREKYSQRVSSFLINKLGIRRKFLKLVLVITSNQMVVIR